MKTINLNYNVIKDENDSVIGYCKEIKNSQGYELVISMRTGSTGSYNIEPALKRFLKQPVINIDDYYTDRDLMVKIDKDANVTIRRYNIVHRTFTKPLE
jgi:hypothetical protein